MTTATEIHVFEKSGLGEYPFTITNVYVDDTGTACEFCGTAIKVVCEVESSCGNRFHVGRDCVKKTGDRGLINVLKLIEKEKRQSASLIERQKKIDALHEKQRQANGGLTNEQAFKILCTELDTEFEIWAEDARAEVQDIIDLVNAKIEESHSNHRPNQFAMSMLCLLMNVESPSNRQARALMDMLAKISGRKNSTLYADRIKELEQRLPKYWDSVEEKREYFKSMRNQFIQKYVTGGSTHG